MLNKRSTLALTAAVFSGALMASMTPSSAGKLKKVESRIGFADDYHGYHLRPPYYIDGRWQYPPQHPSGPELYYGYHFHHAPAYPVPIYGTDRPVVLYRPAVRYRVVASAHIDWCQSRYRSYRPQDNTFQPYHGRRRQCWSPYS